VIDSDHAELIHTGAMGRRSVRARASLASAIKVIHAAGQPASARSGTAPVRGTPHASRRPQNGEFVDRVSYVRGRAAPLPPAAWFTAWRMALRPVAPPSANHPTRA